MKDVTLALLWLLSIAPAVADSLHIASAANFRPALEQLLEEFDPGGSHTIRISSASTGALYTQAVHGAPFDVFLAADRVRPQRLEQEGFAVPGTRITYAVGQLVLVYHPSLANLAESGLHSMLNHPGLTLVVANPEIAPYGQAAMQVLKRPDMQSAQPILLRASNVLQAYQMWFSGGADAALVARSLVAKNYLSIPANWYTPLEQQGVLMQKGAGNELARSLMQYLQSDRAREVIGRHGYLVGKSANG